MRRLPADALVLTALPADALAQAIRECRLDIRYHRDQKGDDRCHLDDALVHRHLVDTVPETGVLPLVAERRLQCNDFFAFRQRPGDPQPQSPEAINDPAQWDHDLIAPRDDRQAWLVHELLRVFAAIRTHRDYNKQIFSCRTWQDDVVLYEVLPEKLSADTRLPSREEFIEGWGDSGGCPHFWRSHVSCPAARHNLHEWGPCLPG